MSKNPFGRTRPLENPYAIFSSMSLPGWEWRVLKTYQTYEKEKGNTYARWFCAVKSPMTYGDWEYGDTYVKDILGDGGAELKSACDEWKHTYTS
jgi:hypothetical protein